MEPPVKRSMAAQPRALDAVPAALLEVDRGGRVVQANAAAVALLGLTGEEVSVCALIAPVKAAGGKEQGEQKGGEACCEWCGELRPGLVSVTGGKAGAGRVMVMARGPRASREEDGHVIVLVESPGCFGGESAKLGASALEESKDSALPDTTEILGAPPTPKEAGDRESAKKDGADDIARATLYLDKELRIADLPGALATMLEFTREELLGQTLEFFVNPPAPGFATDAQQRLHTGHTKTGKKLQFALAIRPQPDGLGFEATLSGVTRTENQRTRILASIAAPAVVTDSHMRIVFINSACTDVFGYSVNELLGRNVTVLMPRKLATKHDKFVARYERSGSSSIIGKKPRLVEGRSKLGEKLKLLLTITANDSEGYTAVFTDVTEQHQHSETLESILQSMMSPVIMTDRSMRISFVNRCFTEVFGYAPNEVLGRNVKMLMEGSDAAKHDSYVRNYETTKVGKIIGKPRPRPVVGRHKAGFPLRLGLTLTPNGNRGYTAVFTVECDDAERGRQLQEILLSIKAPVVRAEEDMTITFVNPDFTHVFGYTAEEVIGKNVTCLMKPRQAAQHESYVHRYKSTNTPRIIGGAPRLVHGVHKNGTDLRLYLTITHAAAGFTAVFTNVTEEFEHKERADRIASVSTPVFITDSACNIEYVNECAVKLFQCESSKDLVGKNISTVLVDVNGQHHPDFFAGVIASEAADDDDDGFHEASSYARSCGSSAGLSIDSCEEEGRPIIRGCTQRGDELLMYCSVTQSNSGYTIVFMDVTGQVTSKSQLTQVIRQVATNVIVASRDMTIEYVNEHGLRTFGYSLAEVQRKPMSLLSGDLSKGKDALTLDMLQHANTSENDSPDSNEMKHIIRARTKFGNVILLNASVSFAAGKFLFVLTDVTNSLTLLHKLNAILRATPNLMLIYSAADEDSDSGSKQQQQQQQQEEDGHSSEPALPNVAEDLANLRITLMARSCYTILGLTTPSASSTNGTQEELGDSGVDDDEQNATGMPTASMDQILAQVHPSCQQNVQMLVRDALAWPAGTSRSVECQLASMGGGDTEKDFAWFELTLTRLNHTDVFMSARDISSDVCLRERLRSELVAGSSHLEKAQRDNDHIRRVFGYVSHEYRNMYFGAHALCEDIAEELEGTSTANQMMQVIRIHNRMGQLFDDVLLMQKIEAGEYKYVRSRFRVASVLEDVVAYAEAPKKVAAVQRVRFETDLDPEASGAVVVGSATHLFQALTNIISNAFKYNSPDGWVRLEARLDGSGHIDLFVRDVGVGIPAAKRAVIFEPYKRLATGSHRVGTGLGLTFAKEFVESGSSGTIEVRDNELDGRGTVFHIKLPIEEATAEDYQYEDAAEASKKARANRELTPLDVSKVTLSSASALPKSPRSDDVELPRSFDVLVVDDDDIVRATLGRRLRKLPLFKHVGRAPSVMEASCGEEALALVLEKGYDFSMITMDQDMGPDKYSGSEAIHLLRQGGYKGLIVGITGCEGGSETGQMLSAGAQQVLVKGASVVKDVEALLLEEMGYDNAAAKN